MKTPEEILEENGYDIEDLQETETILFRDPDYVMAIIGVTEDNEIVYDYQLMIEHLIKYEDMGYDDAADWINYNTIRSIPYIQGRKPVIMHKIT